MALRYPLGLIHDKEIDLARMAGSVISPVAMKTGPTAGSPHLLPLTDIFALQSFELFELFGGCPWQRSNFNVYEPSKFREFEITRHVS